MNILKRYLCLICLLCAQLRAEAQQAIKKNPPSTLKVLSIDGGGVRGIIAAKILSSIEEKTHRTISENFDIILGNSTGGLLALALSAPDVHGQSKYTASDLVDFYRAESRNIFRSSFSRKLLSGFGLWGPRYSRSPVDNVLKRLFNDVKLSDMMDNVIVVSYDLGSGLPHLWTSFLPKPDGDFYAYDVAGATSAAPTYFPPKVMCNDRNEYHSEEVDGAIYANNPAAILLAMIRKVDNEKINLDNILLVSIGTGKCSSRTKKHNKAFIKRGIIGWLLYGDIVSTMMEANSELVDSQMAGLFSKYIRIQIPNLPEALMTTSKS